jgi:hypothetical protein
MNLESWFLDYYAETGSADRLREAQSEYRQRASGLVAVIAGVAGLVRKGACRIERWADADLDCTANAQFRHQAN